MPEVGRLSFIVAAGIGGFALLLLIISVGTVTWLDDGNGNTIGLFRACYGNNVSASVISNGYNTGCYSQNQVTQGGLSIFGLLLLVFGIIALILYLFMQRDPILFAALILFYFASMFVMSAYATWGVYARDPTLYFYPLIESVAVPHTSMGASYNLCVASHYFLWTALTILAFGAGYAFSAGRNTTN
jgi:hypothetical protein